MKGEVKLTEETVDLKTGKVKESKDLMVDEEKTPEPEEIIAPEPAKTAESAAPKIGADVTIKDKEEEDKERTPTPEVRNAE